MIKSIAGNAFLLLLTLTTFAAATTLAQNVWTPEMQVKVKTIGASRPSPDGRRVAYTIASEAIAPDKSEYVTQIFLANADGGSIQMTYGDKSSTNPKWSPDGNAIAFLSNRKDNKNNLYVLRLNGGEAEPLTDVKSAVSDFKWSPDGKSIAFLMSDAKTDDEEKNDKGRNDSRWIDENVKMSRLFVVALDKNADGKREPRGLTTENYNVNADFNWSPDNSKIVFSHNRTPSANDWTTADISIVNVSDAKITKLAATNAAENSPFFAPDGKNIAFVASSVPVRWAQDGLINLISVNGGAPRALTASFDGQPNLAGWSNDGKKLYFFEPKGTGTRIYALDTTANKIAEINATDGVLSNVELNHSGTMFGFTMQSPEKPPEAYISKIDNFAPVQISRANADLKMPPLGKTEIVKWKSADGTEIEGLLTYPVNYQTGQKVPLILNVHGGPAGVFNQNFIGGRGSYPIASFASRGIAVLRPNPRGSSGYGTKFRQANIKDWGGMDYQDLMTGVDAVVKMGVADENRLGVMGWSYGGFMTSWIVTQTKRFKAASAGAPVTNLMSFNGTADIPSFVPDYFGGQSYENPTIYAKHSPMFHVKGVSTPVLIQHGESDIRVPISQGYEFYNALKQQNVPVRMIVFPRQPHGLIEPKHQIAAMQSNLDWFEKYLK